MNLDPDIFWTMLPRDFWRKMNGFYRLVNLKERQEWERCRWQTAILLNPHLSKGKTLKPTDLIKFNWDLPDKKKIKADKNKAEYIKKLEDFKLKNKNGE